MSDQSQRRSFLVSPQDGMVQLQSIDQSVNQRSKKEAKLFMPPQWGETLHQVAFLFKITLLKMNVFLQEHMKLQ